MKKLLKGMIAIFAILATLVVPVMAEEATPTTELTIEKDLLVTAGESYPELNFAFSILPATVAEGTTQDGYNVYAGLGQTFTSIKFDAGTSTAGLTDANGTTFAGAKKTTTKDFSEVTFPRPGVYRYEVTETAGTLDAVTYDTTKYIVDVYVANDTTGTPAVKYVISRANNTKTPVIFKNTYTTYKLALSKAVAGNLGDHTKKFTFTVNVEANDCIKAGFKAVASILKKDGTTSNLEIIVGEDNTVELADTEKLTITSLPTGTRVTVSEVEDVTGEYVITVKTNGEAEVVTKDADVTITDKNVTIDYTNTKNGDVPNTGITDGFTPFLTILGILAVYIVAMFVAKAAKNRVEQH